MHPESSWMDDAACKAADPTIFFPEKGATYIPAKLICDTCEVRKPCLEFELKHEGDLSGSNRVGMWGGLTPTQRDKVYRSRKGRRGKKG